MVALRTSQTLKSFERAVATDLEIHHHKMPILLSRKMSVGGDVLKKERRMSRTFPGLACALLVLSLFSWTLLLSAAQEDARAEGEKGLEQCVATSYTFTTIDVPFPGAHDPTATGINNSGQIVGAYSDSNGGLHGFLRRGKGVFTPIDVPNAGTAPHGINNRGQIVGFYSDSSGIHGFVYKNGAVTPIDVPGATLTEAVGINKYGHVVGDYRDSSGTFHGFLYAEGTFTTIDVPGASLTGPQGINRYGEIVGFYDDSSGGRHGFLYDEGVFTTIDVPFPGAVVTALEEINDDGQIVGIYFDNSTLHGFLFDGEVYTTIDVPDASLTHVSGINNRCQIVGRYIDSNGVDHAFVAIPKKK